VAAERDGGGTVVRRYIYGLGLIGEHTANGPTVIHRDGLGSTTDVTSPSGASLAWTEYQPFGVARSAAASASAPTLPFAYGGQYLDATGMYDMRAREYDPTLGRFLSVDPVSSDLRAPRLAAYVYVADNPVSLVDPSGRESQSPCGIASTKIENHMREIQSKLDNFRRDVNGLYPDRLGTHVDSFLGLQRGLNRMLASYAAYGCGEEPAGASDLANAPIPLPDSVTSPNTMPGDTAKAVAVVIVLLTIKLAGLACGPLAPACVVLAP